MMLIAATGTSRFSYFQRTIDAFFFIALIANAYKGTKGIIGAIADNSILIYIGKISYGLYIYHLITPWLTMIFFNILAKCRIAKVDFFISAYHKNIYFLKSILDIAILLSVASISWYFFEKPFNGLKRFFTDQKIQIAGSLNTIPNKFVV